MQKVMVVDDAAFMRMKCRKILVESGFDVVEASNGTEAISVYDESRPDIVLMDITMPDMGGGGGGVGCVEGNQENGP